MLNIKELHEKILDPIHKITRDRKIIKDKIVKHELSKILSEEEIERFHKPVIEKLDETAIVNFARPIEEVALPNEQVALPIEGAKKKQKRYDPSRGYDEQYLESVGLNPPSYFVSEDVEFDLEDIKENIQRAKNIARSIGTKMSHLARKHEKDSEEYRALEEQIFKLREYRELLTQYIKLIERGALHEQSGDGLCNRLSVLVAAKKAGNDSTEVYNESVAILDKLYEKKLIDKSGMKSIYKLLSNK